MLISFLTSFSTEPANYGSRGGIKDYQFSFSQSYTFPHKLVTQNLNQIYFVNQYTIYDFQRDLNRKHRTDDRVEDEVISRLDRKCNDAKK